MKRNKRWQVLLLALVMTMTLAACGNRPTDDVAAADDAAGQLEQDASKPDDAKQDEQKPTDTKTDAKTDANTDANTDDTKTDNTKTDDTKQDTTPKTDTDTKTDTDSKTDTKPADTKPAAPSYDNGSLTTAQVKEMQRWYGIGADGQWGDGSKSAAGGRTADEAWNNYQQNKQAAAPDPDNTGSTGGSTTPDVPSTPDVPADSGSSGGSTGGSTTPTIPTPAEDIDWDEVVRAGNEYAESLGFDSSHPEECFGYTPPTYFEQDSLLFKYDLTQDSAIRIMKDKVDYLKRKLEKTGGFTHMDEGIIGADGQPYASTINCAVVWNEAEGYHEMYVYF